MNNNGFYTKENLKLTVNIFKDYMSESFGLNLESEDDLSNIRKLLFELMNRVNEESKDKNIPIQVKNIKVMNIAKEIYIKRFDLNDKNKKPNIQNLSRDKSIFGNRQVQISSLVPEIDPYNRKNTEQPKEVFIDRLINERNKDIGVEKSKLPTIEEVINPTTEKAEKAEDFIKQLLYFENQRNIVIDDIESRRPKNTNIEQHNILPLLSIDRITADKEINDINNIKNHDPKAIMSKIQNQEAMVPIQNIYSKFSEGNEQMVIPKNNILKTIEKYISINSFDRDWLIEPLRYKYSVNFMTKSNSIQNRYRNIESISISKVIIPDEIIQINNPVKSSFNYEFTFAYPYLILSIDEFNDVYDGTNDNIRKAFCTLVFDKAYKGQNGRGYVVLKPMQHEKKYFYPALLSSLNKLSISIQKPNGALFNSSTDSYNVLKIEYDSSKPNLLKITNDLYFDKNEFYIGDFVIFTNYLMTKLSVIQQDSDIKEFNEYFNNPEGFEIINLDSPNINGFYNVFYINAPGQFNKKIGQYQVKMNLINCLNNYNSQIVTPIPNGHIMNFSLQHSISIKINTVVDDARILDTQSTFNF